MIGRKYAKRNPVANSQSSICAIKQKEWIYWLKYEINFQSFKLITLLLTLKSITQPHILTVSLFFFFLLFMNMKSSWAFFFFLFFYIWIESFCSQSTTKLTTIYEANEVDDMDADAGDDIKLEQLKQQVGRQAGNLLLVFSTIILNNSYESLYLSKWNCNRN